MFLNEHLRKSTEQEQKRSGTGSGSANTEQLGGNGTQPPRNTEREIRNYSGRKPREKASSNCLKKKKN